MIEEYELSSTINKPTSSHVNAVLTVVTHNRHRKWDIAIECLRGKKVVAKFELDITGSTNEAKDFALSQTLAKLAEQLNCRAQDIKLKSIQWRHTADF